MTKEPDVGVVVERGNLRTIEYAVCQNGKMPAKEFIEKLSDNELRRLATRFRLMADTGKVTNKQHFKQVKDKIYEFKQYQTRVGCFQIGMRWILTHGFIKKRDHWPKSEIERAERIMEEHLAREAAKKKKAGRQRR